MIQTHHVYLVEKRHGEPTTKHPEGVPYDALAETEVVELDDLKQLTTEQTPAQVVQTIANL